MCLFCGEGCCAGWTISRVGRSPKWVPHFFPEEKDLYLHQFLNKCTMEKIEEVILDFHIISLVQKITYKHSKYISVGGDTFEI